MKIDLENHFATELWMDALRNNEGYPRVEADKGLGYHPDSWLPMGATGAQDRLLAPAELRIAAMDEAGIDFAVLSLTAPGVEQFPLEVGQSVARDANDRLAATIARHPQRLGGFASLAVKDPEEAVRELERSVKELGFTGWETHSNFGDSYLDEKVYWPILAKSEELGVPIYLHPTVPSIPELRSFGITLSGSNFGFGTDVMFVMLRMIARGVFDAFPNLKVILGHLGEGLPFLLDRVDGGHKAGWAKPNPDIGPGSAHRNSYYLLHNMWVTTSGNYLPAAFYCTRDSIGIGKILLGTDYPYERMGEAVEFLDALDLSEDDRAKVSSGNAGALSFGTKPR